MRCITALSTRHRSFSAVAVAISLVAPSVVLAGGFEDALVPVDPLPSDIELSGLTVHLEIGPDTLQVQRTYRFNNRGDAPHQLALSYLSSGPILVSAGSKSLEAERGEPLSAVALLRRDEPGSESTTALALAWLDKMQPRGNQEDLARGRCGEGDRFACAALAAILHQEGRPQELAVLERRVCEGESAQACEAVREVMSRMREAGETRGTARRDRALLNLPEEGSEEDRTAPEWRISEVVLPAGSAGELTVTQQEQQLPEPSKPLEIPVWGEALLNPNEGAKIEVVIDKPYWAEGYIVAPTAGPGRGRLTRIAAGHGLNFAHVKSPEYDMPGLYSPQDDTGILVYFDIPVGLIPRMALGVGNDMDKSQLAVHLDLLLTIYESRSSTHALGLVADLYLAGAEGDSIARRFLFGPAFEWSYVFKAEPAPYVSLCPHVLVQALPDWELGGGLGGSIGMLVGEVMIALRVSYQATSEPVHVVAGAIQIGTRAAVLGD